MDENTYDRRIEFSFIKLDDFKKDLWGAKVYRGKFAGNTIRKIHENIMQSLGKQGAELRQKTSVEVFFSKFKSPQKSITSEKVSHDENL